MLNWRNHIQNSYTDGICLQVSLADYDRHCIAVDAIGMLKTIGKASEFFNQNLTKI